MSIRNTEKEFFSIFDSPNIMSNTDYIGNIDLLNKLFDTITTELIKYLTIVQKSEFHEINSIKKIIDEDCKIISFNYTNFIQNYSSDVFYIHGTLEKRYIIFGYSAKNESDMLPSVATYHSKMINRNVLLYNKHLKKISNQETFDLKKENCSKPILLIFLV